MSNHNNEIGVVYNSGQGEVLLLKGDFICSGSKHGMTVIRRSKQNCVIIMAPQAILDELDETLTSRGVQFVSRILRPQPTYIDTMLTAQYRVSDIEKIMELCAELGWESTHLTPYDVDMRLMARQRELDAMAIKKEKTWIAVH